MATLESKLALYREALELDLRADPVKRNYRKGDGVTYEQMRDNKIAESLLIEQEGGKQFRRAVAQVDALQHQIEFEMLYHNASCDAIAPPRLSAQITPEQISQAFFARDPLTGLVSQSAISKGVCQLRSYAWDEFSITSPKSSLESIVTNPQPIMKDGKPVEGENGAVYYADLNNRPRALVIKREKPRKGELDPYGLLVHEAFISIKGISRLYERRPNCPPVFSRVLGLASCSRMVDVGVPNWCKPGPGVVVFYEYINGEELQDLVESRRINEKETILILMLLIDGLNQAAQEIGFTHYDLHAGNVLVQDLGQPRSFTLSNGAQIRSRYLPKLIDYGYSRIVLDGLPYGYWKTYNGPHPTHSNIIGDIVRYLVTVAGYFPLTPSLDSLYDVFQTMASFFTREDLRSFAKREEAFHRTKWGGSYYYLPAEFDDRVIDQAVIDRMIEVVQTFVQ